MNTITDKIEAYLKKAGFYKITGKDVWVAGRVPHQRIVDLSIEPPWIGISTGTQRQEAEECGIAQVQDIKNDVLYMYTCNADTKTPAEQEKSPPLDAPAPKPEEVPKRSLAGELEQKGDVGWEKPPEKPKGEVKKMEEKKEEKGLIPQEKAKLPVKAKISDHELEEKIERAKARRFTSGQGDFYKVQGKERPDSAMIQKLANESGISVEITKAEQTDKYAHVEVVGILGNLRVPAVVHHDFDTEFMLKTMEIIQKNKGILDHYEGTNPVLKEGATIKQGDEIVDARYYLIHTLLSFKKFSLRDACTKAMSIVELKLLNQEFRDEEEIKSEQAETDLVERIVGVKG